MTLAKGNN